jgi:hypothetical protein
VGRCGASEATRVDSCTEPLQANEITLSEGQSRDGNAVTPMAEALHLGCRHFHFYGQPLNQGGLAVPKTPKSLSRSACAGVWETTHSAAAMRLWVDSSRIEIAYKPCHSFQLFARETPYLVAPPCLWPRGHLD